jgi:hypothetical protein
MENHLVPRNIVDNDWEHLGDMEKHLVDGKVLVPRIIAL